MRYLSILIVLLIFLALTAPIVITAEEKPTETTGSVSLQNPLQTDNPLVIVGYIIRTMLGVLGAAALLMFVYGGLIWMFSGGNEEKVKKGKQIFLWAVLGMAIILSSYSLLSFIFSRFTAMNNSA